MTTPSDVVEDKSQRNEKSSGEPQIRADFTEWYLKEKNPEAILIGEYKTQENTRVDLAAVEWRQGSDYEVKIWAADSKSEVSPRSIYGYLEQLRGYGRYFPELSLLVRKAKNEDALKVIGEALRVGIYLVVSGSEVREISAPRTRLFDNEGCLRTKTIATLQLIFKEVITNGLSYYSSWGVYSGTPDKVQFNSYLDDYTMDCRLGVNVENIVRLGMDTKMDSTFQSLLSGLPQGTRVNLWREFRFGLDRRRLMIISCNPQDFEVQNVRQLIEEKTTGQSFHINLNLPLWQRYEILSRHQCVMRMREARDRLYPVYHHLSTP